MTTQGRANGYLPASAFTRKERVVIDDSGFHYRTREQKLVGPFDTESAAIFDLNCFVVAKKAELNRASINSSGSGISPRLPSPSEVKPVIN